MARKRHAAPFWRTQTKCFYVKIAGKMVRLSPDRDEAFRIYHAKMAAMPETAAPAPSGTLAWQLIDDFLGWAKANRKPATCDIYARLLQAFVDSIPKALLAAEVRPYHVTRVMDARPSWSRNTKHNFATIVVRAFEWAEKQGLIEKNPIRGLEKPSRENRELAVTPADHAAIVAAIASPQFRDLVELAWETGCRPQEIRAIEARHFDPANRRIVFPPSEAKGGKAHRVIYLGSDKALEVVARLAAARPSGPILLNAKGRPWTKDAINCAFCRLKEKTGVKFHMGAYRKGFVTNALKNGVDTVTLAHLVGHANAAMISRIYGKVQQDPEFMAEASRRASKGRTKPEGGGA
jgi:integrase